MRIKLFTIFILFISIVHSQKKKNTFLERSFWKSKPSVALVKQKIAEGNDPAQLNPYSFDAIAYALLEKQDIVNDEVVKFLLTQKGNDVNKITHDGRTYIFWAAYSNRLDLVKYLIEKGAKLDVIDSHGYTALNFAIVSGVKNTKLFDYLIGAGANLQKDKDLNGANALLLMIPSLNDLTMVDYFTAKGLSIKDTDANGNGAINYAAKEGNKKLIDLLIEKGLPFKEVNKNGGNAFLLATRGSRKGYNSLDFFKYLEKIDINPNITNKQGLTPLHNISYRNKDIATFNYFINKGVNVDQQNEEGNTALINASARNSLDIIKLLASKTSNINAVNKKGNSALTNALKNTPEVISFFLDNKADVTVIDKKGNNLAYYLAKTYNPKKEDVFLTKIDLLKKKGLEITKPQKNGNTLVHIAANEGNISLLKFLQSYNIDINAKNKEGQTALQKAVMVAKNPKIIEFLLKNGADKTVTTSFDETIYDLAKENEQLSKFDLNFLK
ncbi:ankyrin repeat domain-containing protein [Tenacibaculum sp. M341]|uniref:ankyrin repeat domain-containing protein n=1 Tax=Tenacibaculum sp. M341 TaxID=2530339 RepID=UPI00104F6716|nr:ankyrin repeat domain-containing protein [Tenacibaculum sp. M341]TCI93511.1 ankyrin repeat domain-containing protein [Tenacibaculum sp. M341]